MAIYETNILTFSAQSTKANLYTLVNRYTRYNKNKLKNSFGKLKLLHIIAVSS